MKDLHKEIQNIDEEDLPVESKIKKQVILALAILLVLLIGSYTIVTSPIGNIIEGRIESDEVKNNLIEVDGLSIIFQGDSYQNLRTEYFEEQEVEFSLCLLGKKEGNNYNIGSFYKPVIYDQSLRYVSFEPCSADTLIILHTHPYKSCIASQADIRSLERAKETNPDVLMVVMCEPTRFSVYP